MLIFCLTLISSTSGYVSLCSVRKRSTSEGTKWFHYNLQHMVIAVFEIQLKISFAFPDWPSTWASKKTCSYTIHATMFTYIFMRASMCVYVNPVSEFHFRPAPTIIIGPAVLKATAALSIHPFNILLLTVALIFCDCKPPPRAHKYQAYE